MILLSNSLDDGKKLAQRLGARFSYMEEKIYPDSEKALYVRPEIKRADIIYFKFHDRGASFDDQLLDLLVALRWFGNKKITKLVLPYLPYCRSYNKHDTGVDKFVFFLEEVAKRVKTLYIVAPHSEEFLGFAKELGLQVENIDIDGATIQYIKSFGKKPVLVSPDWGFSKSIMRLARKSGLQYIVLSKKRISPHKVAVTADEMTRMIIDANKKHPFVVLDDIVSTGGTLLKVGKYLKSCGINNIYYSTVHDTRGKIKTKIPVMCSNSITCAGKKAYDITEDIARAIRGKK